MIFGPDHYVPVLKVKRGEKAALRLIPPALQQRVTPLLEIVVRKAGKTVHEHLDTALAGLADSVRHYSRCFLDAREIEADGPLAAADVFRRASAAGIVFTPVTGVSRTADVAAALAHRAHGVALRLTKEEFEEGGLTADLMGFVSGHALAPEETDIILDLGPVDDLVVDGVAALTEAFLADVPDHRRWRTLTVSACAFPLSMKGVARNSQAHVERAEWIAWKDHLHARRRHLSRLPTFSDCAIQRPEGVEGFNPKMMHVSASVRYALSDDWLLIKGEGTHIRAAKLQFPALAKMLVYGSLKSQYAGADHCQGCASMKAAADGAPRLGSPEAWRRLGTIHHISTVMDGLGALAWP